MAMNNTTSTPIFKCNAKPTFKEISFSIFLILVVVTSVFGNSLVIAASFLSHQLRKRKCIYFIASLAVSDMGYASLVVSISISMKLNVDNFCHSLALCYFMHLMDFVTSTNSIFNMLAIAVDRFIAITKPFRYPEIVTTRRIRSAVVGIWVFSVLWSFSSVFSWGRYIDKGNGNNTVPIWSTRVEVRRGMRICRQSNNSYFLGTANIGIFITPLILMSFTYLSVLKVALKQIEAIRATQVNDWQLVGSPDVNGVSIRKDSLKSRSSRKSQQWFTLSKEWQATKSVLIVFLCFCVCYIPMVVINTCVLFNPNTFTLLPHNQRILIIYIFIYILPPLHTVMNPIIYSFSNKHFRKGFRSVFRKIFPERQKRQQDSIAMGNMNSRGSSAAFYLNERYVQD